MSVSKENSSTTEVLESISKSVRVKPENLRLTEVRLILQPPNSIITDMHLQVRCQVYKHDTFTKEGLGSDTYNVHTERAIVSFFYCSFMKMWY